MPLVSLYLSGSLYETIEKIRGHISTPAFIRKLLSEKLIPDQVPNSSVKCKRCGYQWMPRVDTPSYCARCKSPGWSSAPKARAIYPGLHELAVGGKIVLPWMSRPDPKPLRAVMYEQRRYGKRFGWIATAAGLEVTRLQDTVDDLPV